MHTCRLAGQNVDGGRSTTPPTTKATGNRTRATAEMSVNDARSIAGELESFGGEAPAPLSELRWKVGSEPPRQPTDLALFVRGLRPRGQVCRRNSRRSAHSSPTRVRGCARCALAARCQLEPCSDSVRCLLPAAPCSVRQRNHPRTVTNRPTPCSPSCQSCAGVKRRVDESSGGAADDERRHVVPEASAESWWEASGRWRSSLSSPVTC